MIIEQYTKLEYMYGDRRFGSRGHYVEAGGDNKQAVKKHILFILNNF